ncbi:unnamed protein product [Rotaria sp. Silwood1]|nr:unnamed protein product [Rotaria sp. Silwood1]CAF3330810.1 unnamed protein product [Rotaria sp. Silwood1]CAF3359708.1 unnamed protein product [Rotaria sp. Silwood1]CAF4690294.1 unnamed protein product [Rotaria sp. Silwood1]CAF4716161.1 unnamed protein product [Rotaria sp. Silwood1]
MPLKAVLPAEYTEGGTPIKHGILRRLNPIIFLSICCTMLILIIVAALFLLTFLPIFTSAKGNQTKYQVQSDVLTLVYNLPDRLSILLMNWTYANSSASLDSVNDKVIVLTQPDSSIKSNSTPPQLTMSLMLRYALECAKRCQKNMKESIFSKTFYRLELPIDTFRTLFIEEMDTSISKSLSSSTWSYTESTTLMPCIVNVPSSMPVSSILMAINYEAESSLNTFISTTIQLCSVCSGAQNVGNIGFNNELIFQQIISQHGGSTIVIIYYVTDRIRSAEMMVNDLYPSINVTFPMMLPNQNIASLPIALNLCQGFNSIRIYNSNDYTPAVDRIVVY